MNDIDKLVHFYNSTKSGDVYHDVVGQILQHLPELDGLTIYEMADLCFASPTTLSRLSKKLGFVSFSDFKNNMVSAVRGYSALNRSMPYTPTRDTTETLRLYNKTVTEAIQRCHGTLDPAYIDRIVEDMARFEGVYFVSNAPLASTSFQQDILISGKQTQCTNNCEEGLELAPRLDDKAFVISPIPKLQESIQMMEVLKAVRQSGATTLVISPAILSPYDKYADYLISYEGTGNSIDQYTFIYVLNVLTMAYRARYID